MREVGGAQVLAFRVRAQQLDRDAGTIADTAVLDVGVQDTGTDGGRWALANRGVPLADTAPGTATGDGLALVWTVRGAPHLYRRADLPAVAAATAPWSDADAGKRIFDANKPLKAAGIPAQAALDTVAAAMQSIVTAPTVKGVMSAGLTAALPAPYLRNCVPCGAVHVFEMPFRLAALRAGLELTPDTSPPVLRPIPGFAPAAVVPAQLDLVRSYLRLLGPATPKQVAEYVDAPVREVTARWPEDAVEVGVQGERRWVLAADLERLAAEPVSGVRLLGAFDLFLQARDRELLVADPVRRRDLWRTLGRPGGVLADGGIAGTWRARKTGPAVAVTVELWSPADTRAISEQAERLAAARGLRLSAVDIG